jgi:hypothetical protein
MARTSTPAPAPHAARSAAETATTPAPAPVAPAAADSPAAAVLAALSAGPARAAVAVVPLAGICAGGRPQGRSLPRIIDLDVRKFFDTVPWDRILAAVEANTALPWVILYVKRWLAAPIATPLIRRPAGSRPSDAIPDS